MTVRIVGNRPPVRYREAVSRIDVRRARGRCGRYGRSRPGLFRRELAGAGSEVDHACSRLTLALEADLDADLAQEGRCPAQPASRLRDEIGALGLSYVAGIPPQTSVWPPGTAPLPPLPWSGRGRRPKLMRRDAEHRPVSVKALALDLPAASWQTISWREGSAGALISRFARVRVRAAHRDEWRAEPRDEEWLLIEWPEGDAEPAKYWLATVPPDMPFDRLVDLAKLRWRIERDYQELKQELGLGHYEGRGWRGFHHHATLCIAAYAFLIAERARLSPSAAGDAADKFATSEVSQNRPPRGAARPPRTTCRKLDRDNAPTPDRRSRKHPGAMSLLQRTAQNHRCHSNSMTQ